MDKSKIVTLLAKEIPTSQIYVDEPMKKHTSFKIGGNAEILIKIKRTEELEYAILLAKENTIPITIVGNGSNILVKDNGIKGLVLQIELTKTQIEAVGNEYIVTVGAGNKLAQLAQTFLKESLTGFEFASGIPGTIGGAIRMNAGAYGKEMKDIVIETKCLNLEALDTKTNDIETVRKNEAKSLHYITLDNQGQNFFYRHSIFVERKYIVVEAKLKLSKGNTEEIKSKMEEYTQSRKEKQPLQMPSAGSTFKRGQDFMTAKLIDECGLKGYTIGEAGVSELHAGFIVNKGNATAEDVIELIEHVKKVVKEKTGKQIELEIEIIGE